MRDYETMIVLVPDLPQEEITKIIDRVKSIIEEDGKVESVEEWGLRNLAYKIKKTYTEGYYILINFQSNNEVLEELEHFYRITDSIIRSIIVKQEKKRK